MTLMAVASAAFLIFVVRMAGTFYARSLALKAALDGLSRHSALAHEANREAQDGRLRWEMIFHHSPMARLCVDASRLYEMLDVTLPLVGVRFGDQLRESISSIAELFETITLLEANAEAIDLCGDRLSQPHLTEASLDEFCAALNAIDDDGDLPAFAAELIRADGSTMEIEVHFRVAAATARPGACAWRPMSTSPMRAGPRGSRRTRYGPPRSPTAPRATSWPP